MENLAIGKLSDDRKGDLARMLGSFRRSFRKENFSLAFRALELFHGYINLYGIGLTLTQYEDLGSRFNCLAKALESSGMEESAKSKKLSGYYADLGNYFRERESSPQLYLNF